MFSTSNPHWLLCAMLFCLPATASAQDNHWTRFHGPNGTGVALDAKLPATWNEDAYTWKVDLPGVGSGSPVIWGDRIFVNSSDPDTAELTALCLAADDGRTLWKRNFPSAKHHLHPNNTFASSTMAVDDQHVYVTFANTEHTWLIALSHDGKDSWERDFGSYVSSHGYGSSPMVHDGKVILFDSQQAAQLKDGQQPGSSRMIAVSSDDGSDVWETPLDAKRVCYGVPCIAKQKDGTEELVDANTRNGFFGIDPDNGELKWSTKDTFSMRVVASPVLSNDLLLCSTGSGGGGNYLVAVALDSASANGPKEVYRIPSSSYVPSPIVVDDLLFIFTDKGIAACYDVMTGKQHWKKRVAKGFSGSPVATKDNVYVIDEEGGIHVVAVSKEPQVSVADSMEQTSRSTPAISGNRIYFRSDSKLFALDGSK